MLSSRTVVVFFAVAAAVMSVASATVAKRTVIPDQDTPLSTNNAYTNEQARYAFEEDDIRYPPYSGPIRDHFVSAGYVNGVRYVYHWAGSDKAIGGQPARPNGLYINATVVYEQYQYGAPQATASTGDEYFLTLNVLADAPTGNSAPAPFRSFNPFAVPDFNMMGKDHVQGQIGSLSLNAARGWDETMWHYYGLIGGPNTLMEIHRISKEGKSDADAAADYVNLGYPLIQNITAFFYGPALGCVEDIPFAYVPFYLEQNATIEEVRANLSAGIRLRTAPLETLTFDPNFFSCIAGGPCACPGGLTLPSGGKRTVADEDVVPQLPHKFARKLHNDRHHAKPASMSAAAARGLAKARHAHATGTARIVRAHSE